MVTLYENTPENAAGVGWSNPAVADNCVGEKTLPYVVHNDVSGYFYFVKDMPLLDVKVDTEHAKKVCGIGRGAQCCGYLTSGRTGWSCEKFGYFRNQLERRMKLSRAGLADANEHINAQSDNCEGRSP